MRWLGERSYSIYLWNILARAACLTLFGHTLFGDVVWVVMFVVLAELSFRFIERPLRARYGRKPAGSVSPSPVQLAVGYSPQGGAE